MMSPELLRQAIRSFPTCTNADQVLGQVAALVVPAFGQWCLADRLDEPDLVTRVAALGLDGPLHCRAGWAGPTGTAPPPAPWACWPR